MKKVLDWAFCVWLVATTARFALTTWKTLHNPFNPGDDVGLFGLSIAVCVVALVVLALFPPWKVWKVGLPLCCVPAAGILIASGVGLSALIALWLLLVCAAIGLFILRRLKVPEDSEHSLVLAIPLGMAPVSLLIFGLGLAGWLSAVSIWVVLTLVSLGAFRKTRQAWAHNFTSFRNLPSECVLPALLIVFSAILNLTWAVAPEIQFDALNYHLAIPQAYLRAGAIIDVRFLHAYHSKLLELVFTAGLALGGAAAVKLFVYALGLCAAAATYALGKALFSARAGMWAAAFFYTAPVVGWETGTVYIDNIIALLCAAALMCFVKWYQTRTANWFVVASIIAGLAVGSKVNAAFVFIIVLPLMAFGLWRKWGTVLTGAAAFLTVALPTYVLMWVYTGNPVFPLLNKFFNSPYWLPINTIYNSADFGLPKLFVNLGVFPFRLTLDTIRFGETMPRGAVGMTLLVAAFAYLFLPRLGKAAAVLVVSASLYLVLLFYTMQYARYFIPILPVVAVLAAGVGFSTELGKTRRWMPRLVEGCFVVGIVMQFPALSAQYWMLPQRFPLKVAVGLEDRESFIRRTTWGYAAAQHLNDVLKNGDRILGLDVEYLRYYLNAPLVTPSISLVGDPVRELSDISSVRKAGFTHLFVTETRLHHSPPDYPYLDPTFLKNNAELIYSDKEASVFRFRE